MQAGPQHDKNVIVKSKGHCEVFLSHNDVIIASCARRDGGAWE